MTEVSVIVAARNAQRGVGALIDSLDRQTLGRVAFEVIVVDDASTDATADAVARGGLASVIRAPRRGGSYAARNLGLAQARAPVVAVTDADCRPRPDWLERGLEELDALGADLVGGRIEMALSGKPTLAELIDFARGLDQRRCVEEWGFAATANLFVKRSVIDVVGPFNDGLVSGGDLEFSERATQAGFKLAYSPRAVVDHEVRTRARQVARKAFRVGFGLAQVRRRGGAVSRARPLVWAQPRAWRPRHGLLGIETLHAAGYVPSRGRLVALDVAQYVFDQVPLALGNLAATVRERGRS
jgi:glycosyltransferase involved in cell wall biosynthesis